MSDPAIKAALDAATYACQNAMDQNGMVPPDWSDRTAAAIAAFLRALPAGGTGIIMRHNESLAAAVEKATRDAG